MSTVQVCVKYGLSEQRIRHLLMTRRLDPPPRGPDGCFRWGEQDIARLLPLIPSDSWRKARKAGDVSG